MPTQPPPPPERQKKAAALAYDKSSDSAPKLTAKGRGQVADKIIAVAREHGIPVQKDADLMEILDKVEIDSEIPLEVYSVVADIFAYIYKVNAQRKQG